VSALLEIDDLAVFYGGVRALEGIGLRVAAGQVVTVIGPNGAGKTTLLNAVMGILPARGALRFDGRAMPLGIEARVGLGLSLVPETRELFATMSVADNLLLGGYRHRREGMRALKAGRDAVFALFPRLAERAGQAAGTLSGGERQMLAMGRALMARPRLLMLDEPSLGLAPLIVRDIFTAIAGLRDSGVAVLLVEQNARAALEAADEATVLETGRITLSGAAAALAADPRVVEMYLGQTKTHEED
jgi:branched-chain amino acid transport system ATP-binding protein